MANDPDRPPVPQGADKATEVRTAPPPDEPPPDAGEPMGADDDRPSMLGKRFRQTELIGMAVGLVLALLAHLIFAEQFFGRDANDNGWSWLLAAIGGIAVGGALTLFMYGVATDRDDTGPKRRGQADVSTEGEDHRSRRRRRAARSR
jgi:hypothetical protein